MKKFCLIVTFEKGQNAYLTDTPDLVEALDRLMKKLNTEDTWATHKSATINNIVSARIIQVSECLY